MCGIYATGTRRLATPRAISVREVLGALGALVARVRTLARRELRREPGEGRRKTHVRGGGEVAC